MILKMKKTLFLSPNPSFLFKLSETKINQICFLETNQNVSVRERATKYLLTLGHPSPHILSSASEGGRGGGLTIENIIFFMGGGQRYEIIKGISSDKIRALCGWVCGVAN